MFIQEPNFSANSFLTSTLVMGLINSFGQLRILKLNRLGINTTLISIPTGTGGNTVPSTTFINNIERNLESLAEGTRVEGQIIAKTWLGGLRDEKRLDFNDVNRWFRAINMIWEVL